MSVDEELGIKHVGWNGGDTHMHRHLEVRINAGSPFFLADGQCGEFRWHTNVLRTSDENLGV